MMITVFIYEQSIHLSYYKEYEKSIQM